MWIYTYTHKYKPFNIKTPGQIHVALIKKNFITSHSPSPQNKGKQARNQSYLWDLKKKKKIIKSLFPYFLLIFFTCSDKGEITVPNPFCLRKHHQLTVASAPTILQTPLGLQEGSAWALTQLNTQLPSGIRPYLLVYLLDSQTYTHVHM